MDAKHLYGFLEDIDEAIFNVHARQIQEEEEKKLMPSKSHKSFRVFMTKFLKKINKKDNVLLALYYLQTGQLQNESSSLSDCYDILQNHFPDDFWNIKMLLESNREKVHAHEDHTYSLSQL